MRSSAACTVASNRSVARRSGVHLCQASLRTPQVSRRKTHRCRRSMRVSSWCAACKMAFGPRNSSQCHTHALSSFDVFTARIRMEIALTLFLSLVCTLCHFVLRMQLERFARVAHLRPPVSPFASCADRTARSIPITQICTHSGRLLHSGVRCGNRHHSVRCCLSRELPACRSCRFAARGSYVFCSRLNRPLCEHSSAMTPSEAICP